MYRKYQNTYFLPGFFLICLILFSNYGCDSLIPEDLKDKDFSSESVDVNAASQLAGVAGTDSAIYKDSYIVKARTILTMVDSITREQLNQGTITEDQIITSKFNLLTDILKATPIITDVVMAIGVRNVGASIDTTDLVATFDTTSTVSYAFFNVTAGQSKDIYIYTSLMFNSSNLNEYCSIQLIKSDGSRVSASLDMPQETVSAGTQVIPVSGGTRLVPTIKTRYSVHVDEGMYLVKIIKSNTQVNFGRFIKLIILSK